VSSPSNTRGHVQSVLWQKKLRKSQWNTVRSCYHW